MRGEEEDGDRLSVDPQPTRNRKGDCCVRDGQTLVFSRQTFLKQPLRARGRPRLRPHGEHATAVITRVF